MRLTSETITLEQAEAALTLYNAGNYRGSKNVNVDQEARALFASGLAATEAGIHRQVAFIGREYGGVAGFPSANALAPAIAQDIFRVREQYQASATAARPITELPAGRDVLEVLYEPFVKPFKGKSRWQVWATKFWHFLNPDAFVLEDSRVDKFFRLENQSHSLDKYQQLLLRYREFTLRRADWLPRLRTLDGGHAWNDVKLWDKVCYGAAEL